jgi:hypothetical protein
VKPAGISGKKEKKKRENIPKKKLMSLQRTVRTSTSETCIEAYINLKEVTNTELT